MISLISISVALLVVVAGLMLLAKTKKEQLGGVFTFASYAVTTIGLIVLAAAFAIGICQMCCSRGGNCGKGAKAGCYASSCSHSGSQSSWQACAKQGCEKRGCSKDSRCSKPCCAKRCSSKERHTSASSVDTILVENIETGEVEQKVITEKGK